MWGTLRGDSEREKLRNVAKGTSLVVQCLRLHVTNAGGTGSIPGQGTKISLGAAKNKIKIL